MRYVVVGIERLIHWNTDAYIGTARSEIVNTRCYTAAWAHVLAERLTLEMYPEGQDYDMDIYFHVWDTKLNKPVYKQEPIMYGPVHLNEDEQLSDALPF